MTKPKHDYAEIFLGCRRNETAALEQLHALHQKFRYMIYRQLSDPEAAHDILQETYLIVLSAIRSNQIRNPYGLMAFIRIVVKRQIATRIEQLVKHRQDVNTEELDGLGFASPQLNPEQVSERTEVWRLVQGALSKLNEEERQILVRFYLQEQTPAQICAALRITPTQFRLNKSRALSLFGEHGKSYLASGHFLKHIPQPKNKTLRRIAQLPKLEELPLAA